MTEIYTLCMVLQGVFISKIAEGGTAERDNRLQVGDKVLSVRTKLVTTYSKVRTRTIFLDF